MCWLVDVEWCECNTAEKKQVKKVEDTKVVSDVRECVWWCLKESALRIDDSDNSNHKQNKFLNNQFYHYSIISKMMIMETFNFQFKLNYSYKLHYYKGNLQLVSLSLKNKRLLLQAQKKKMRKKEKFVCSLFVLEVVSSRNF